LLLVAAVADTVTVVATEVAVVAVALAALEPELLL